MLAGVFERAFKIVGLGKVSIHGLCRLDKENVELLSTPLRYRQHLKNDILIERTSIVCCIAFGKFLTVQEGVSFSGGSWDDA